MYLYYKEGAEMARISVEELHRGESGGAEYGIPKEYDEQTYLLIKHTLKAAEQMKTEGDFVSGMTNAEPLSRYMEV